MVLGHAELTSVRREERLGTGPDPSRRWSPGRDRPRRRAADRACSPSAPRWGRTRRCPGRRRAPTPPACRRASSRRSARSRGRARRTRGCRDGVAWNSSSACAAMGGNHSVRQSWYTSCTGWLEVVVSLLRRGSARLQGETGGRRAGELAGSAGGRCPDLASSATILSPGDADHKLGAHTARCRPADHCGPADTAAASAAADAQSSPRVAPSGRHDAGIVPSACRPPATSLPAARLDAGTSSPTTSPSRISDDAVAGGGHVGVVGHQHEGRAGGDVDLAHHGDDVGRTRRCRGCPWARRPG